MQNNQLLPYYSIRPNYITTYYQSPYPSNQSIGGSVLIKKPNSNKEGRNISIKGVRRLRNAINWLVELSENKSIYNPSSSSYFYFKINFITLTLPCLQMHLDNTIKKQCLNLFMTELRNYHALRNYVWRAEAQGNGNIHFHIATDSYINHVVVRNIWNRQLKRLGYIQRYHNKFSNMSYLEYRNYLLKQGVKDSNVILNRWKRGNNSNWYNPNTADVHSTRKLKNISSYLAKYMGKGILKKEGKESYSLQERKIKGKKWGCSQSISRCKGIGDLLNDRIKDIIDYSVNILNCHVIRDTYYNVFCVRLSDLGKKYRVWYRDLIKEYKRLVEYESGGIGERFYKII